jgi:FkbM family methyltransferase
MMPKLAATDTRYGRMAYYADDQFIGYCLERYGEYSEAEPQLWRKLVKEGQTVLDVGANIGALTLPLADMVGPDGRVHAFEPHLDNYRLLVTNCAERKNIETWNYALGSREDIVSYAPFDTLGHTNYGGIELIDGNNGHPVQVLTIDDLNIVPVHFMKIDVEGWEVDVLTGAEDTISEYRPIMYVENDRPDEARKLSELLVSIDYVSFQHNPKLCSADNFKKRTVGRHENIISLNALCVPNERATEVAKAIFR